MQQTKMKAAMREQYCSADQMEIREIPIPQPKADEVLVRVHCTTVNRTDEGVLLGKPYIFRFFVGWPKPRYQVLGTDFAGEVVALGANVMGFEKGDRVFGFMDHGLPTQAEYAAIPISKPILPIPDGVSYHDAVASLEGVHYAINFLKHLHLPADARVLVYGGTGAIGSAAFQLLQLQGIDTTTVCGTAHVQRLKDLGAKRVLDYQTTDITALPEQFDAVLDAVGKLSFGQVKSILKPHGVYLSSELGPGGENIPLAIKGKFQKGKRVVFPIPENIHSSMETIIPHLAAGRFKPLIDRTYTLDQAAEAYRYMLSGQKIGNVVLDCSTALA